MRSGAGTPAARIPRLVPSTGTTASAPGGSVAPVMMRAACPGASVSSGAFPAGISATTSSVTGESGPAAATSAAITAKPSIAELANGGRSNPATTGSARARPAAACNGTRSTSNGETAESNCSSACRTGVSLGDGLLMGAELYHPATGCRGVSWSARGGHPPRCPAARRDPEYG